jgi:hypothetical protein
MNLAAASHATTCRLLLEVMEAVAAAIGPARVGLRLSPYNTFLDACDSVERAIEKNVWLMQQLDNRVPGLAYMHMVSVMRRTAAASRLLYMAGILAASNALATIASGRKAKADMQLTLLLPPLYMNADASCPLRLSPAWLVAMLRWRAPLHTLLLPLTLLPLSCCCCCCCCCSHVQVEPRLAGGNAEVEGPIEHSLEPFRKATRLPFLAAGGEPQS